MVVPVMQTGTLHGEVDNPAAEACQPPDGVVDMPKRVG
jgi:hypothetical protein